ncbi:hypothetical protein TrispH2_010932 [Trichoplax sp. H2]|nr:hypothetical protein TrispH2_010932 [Trichoplax sp. H2]|eukprot:RDD36588.1 hypothetical protein TrispH2_010932 [Trichoplax sp. H2]
MDVNDPDSARLAMSQVMKCRDKHWVVVPIKMKDNHRAVMVIEKIIAKKPFVIYFDSHSTHEDNSQVVQQIIDGSGKKFDIFKLSMPELNQKCNYTYGTWMLKAIKAITHASNASRSEQMVRAIVHEYLKEVNIEKSHDSNFQFRDTRMYEDRSDKACKEPGYLFNLQINGAASVKNLHAPFRWRSIPTLAVITGKNGCVKTAVLDAILQGCENQLVSRNFGVALDINEDSGRILPEIYSYSTGSPDGSLPYNLKFSRLQSPYYEIRNQVLEMDKLSSVLIIRNDFITTSKQELKEHFDGQVGLHLATFGTFDQFSKYLLEKSPKLSI